MPESERTVKMTMSCPGYHSEVSFPIDSDATEAFIAWCEMQLSYLGRWTPGSSANHRETIPLGAVPGTAGPVVGAHMKREVA